MTKLIDSIIFKFKKIMKGIRYIRYFPKVSSNKLTRFSTWDAELGWCPKPGMQKKDSVSKGVLKGDPPFWTIDKIGSRITSRSKNTKNNIDFFKNLCYFCAYYFTNYKCQTK